MLQCDTLREKVERAGERKSLQFFRRQKQGQDFVQGAFPVCVEAHELQSFYAIRSLILFYVRVKRARAESV